MKKPRRGRPRKISPKQHVQIKAMRKNNIPIAFIAQKMNVTDMTVRKYLSLRLGT